MKNNFLSSRNTKDVPFESTLSILLSTRNQIELLSKCVDGILRQTWSAWEFLIFDDASKDGTDEFLHRLAAKDQRVKIFRAKKRQGAIKGYNFLLKRAKGKFIWSVASDDFCFRNNFLFEGFSFLEDNNGAAGFCAACRSKFFPSGKEGPLFTIQNKNALLDQATIINGFFNHHGSIPGASSVVKKIWVDRLGGFRPELGPYCDLFLNTAAAVSEGFFYFSEPAVCVGMFTERKSFARSPCPVKWASYLVNLEILLLPYFPPSLFKKSDQEFWRITRINDFLQTEHRLRSARRAGGKKGLIFIQELRQDLTTVLSSLRKDLANGGLLPPPDDEVILKACLSAPWKDPVRRMAKRLIKSFRKRLFSFISSTDRAL